MCKLVIYLCQILIIFSRQLESLIRLAEAHARLRFSHNVEVVDVEEATRLHREALKQSAIDPSTGNLFSLFMVKKSFLKGSRSVVIRPLTIL